MSESSTKRCRDCAGRSAIEWWWVEASCVPIRSLIAILGPVNSVRCTKFRYGVDVVWQHTQRYTREDLPLLRLPAPRRGARNLVKALREKLADGFTGHQYLPRLLDRWDEAICSDCASGDSADSPKHGEYGVR